MSIRKGCVSGSVLRTHLFLFFGLAALSQFCLAENHPPDKISFSPPLISEDQFLIAYGRVTASNDFLSRDTESISAVGGSCSVTNMHARRHGSYEIDGESYVCGLRYETSYKNHFRISVSSSFMHSGGGVFDSFIRNFHDTFYFPNGPRTRNNQNRYIASGNLQSGDTFSIKSEKFGVQDPVAAVSVPLLNFGHLDNLFLETALSIPLGLSEFSLAAPDARLGVVLEGERSWITYATGVSTVLHTARKKHGVVYNRFHHGGFLSANIPLDETFHLLVGLLARSSITDDIENFPGYAVYLDTGFRIIPFRDHFFDVILRENPFPVKATADVSFFIRYNFRIPNEIP